MCVCVCVKEREREWEWVREITNRHRCYGYMWVHVHVGMWTLSVHVHDSWRLGLTHQYSTTVTLHTHRELINLAVPTRTQPNETYNLPNDFQFWHNDRVVLTHLCNKARRLSTTKCLLFHIKALHALPLSYHYRKTWLLSVALITSTVSSLFVFTYIL